MKLNHIIYGSRFQAHVLVGTAASNLNLSHNPCARALSLSAGPGLQQECSTKGQVKVGDIAEVGPGNLNCRSVYFAVCSQWSGGRGEKVHPAFLTAYSWLSLQFKKSILTRSTQDTLMYSLTTVAYQ